MAYLLPIVQRYAILNFMVRILFDKKIARASPYGHLAKEILYYLALGVSIYFICSSPAGTRRFLKNIKKEWSRKSARASLSSLHKNGFISYREKHNGTTIVTITQKGRRKVKEWNLEHLIIKKPEKWDGRWRIVAFDIAEKRRKGRNALRKMLQKLGFLRIQKSIFIHPYSCKQELEFLMNFFLIPEREVLYISTDKFPQEQLFKKKFHI